MNNLIGRTIGEYQIIAHLGRRGGGELYQAYQPGPDRTVCLKAFESSGRDDDFTARFERAARALASLRHPHIVEVLDYGCEADLCFIVTAYFEAITLEEELKARQAEDRPFSQMEISLIFDALSSALDYAHSQGVLHHDLQPANVLIDQTGHVFLTDFDLAHLVGQAGDVTQAGAFSGAVAYLSPEQAQGQPADARSDLYSLDVILYEMATGTAPYEADTSLDVIMKHIGEPVPLPGQRNPNLPAEVEQVIVKAMSKNPADRYQTAGEMATAFREAAGMTTAKGGWSEATPEIMAPPSKPQPEVGPPGPPTVLEEIPMPAPEPSGPPETAPALPPTPAEDRPEPVTELRLDAAVPDRVTLGRTFDLAVAIRRFSSPLLAEADLNQVHSGELQVAWPEGESSIRLRLQVSAPACEVHEPGHYVFRLYRGEDSPVFYFQLTPKEEGPISLIVIVYQEDEWLGSARVQTLVHERVAGKVKIEVTSEPMSTPSVEALDSLRRQLSIHHTNLLKLQEQAAIYGAGQTPLYLLNQIDAEEEAIGALEAKLEQLQGRGEGVE